MTRPDLTEPDRSFLQGLGVSSRERLFEHSSYFGGGRGRNQVLPSFRGIGWPVRALNAVNLHTEASRGVQNASVTSSSSASVRKFTLRLRTDAAQGVQSASVTSRSSASVRKLT